MPAKPMTPMQSFVASAAMPVSCAIGAVVGALISHAFDWHVLGVLFGLVAGATSAGACWGKFFVHFSQIPEPPKLLDAEAAAGDAYWRAYVDANEGLGEQSLSAESATRDLRRSQIPSLGPWSSRLRAHASPSCDDRSDYWRDYHRDDPPIRSRDLVGEAFSDFSRTQLGARVSYGDEYVTQDNWRSEIRMPVFQPGQSAATYWAQFDRTRLGADQLSHDERYPAAVAGRVQLAEPEHIDNVSPPFDQSRASLETTRKAYVDDPTSHVRSYARLPPHLALIEETNLVRKKLAHASKIHAGELGLCLGAIASSVDAIVAGLKDDPLKLFEVQRLFTYYLPEVGNLLAARAHMTTIGQHERVSDIDAILVRIQSAVGAFARRMHESDIRALDIDLKLLVQSLAAEFETPIGT